jgi:hypothetical protein
MMKIAMALMLASLAAAEPTEVTFHRNVAPVLQQRCVGCHRPGEVGPMSFLTYASTRPWAKAIREAVKTKRMPPWFADAPHGVFANDPSLTAAEINTLVRWADSGAAEGDPKTAPAPVQFTDGWNIGTPDLVISMPKPYVVPPTGVVEYQHIVVPTGFREDKWVKAVEIRPGNRAVVHHAIALVRPPGSSWLRQAQPGVPVTSTARVTTLPVEEMPEYLLSYTPGRPPAGLPEGQARLIKAGSDIVFQMHYTPNGKETIDQSKVGFIFAQSTPKERVATLPIANRSFVIPPGVPDHRVEATARVTHSARLLRLIPHMHVRGKAFEVRLVASGKTTRLLRVPQYDFRWQNAYSLEEPILLTEGDRLECTAWYDNSKNNPFNPDATAEVRWGDQTWEEMMLNYVDIAVPINVEPKRVLSHSPATGTSPN